jgi:arylsulfatase A-like enzyme
VPASWSPESTADLRGLGPQTPLNVGGFSCNVTTSNSTEAEQQQQQQQQPCYYEPLWHRCTRPASTFCINTTAAQAEDGSTAALTKAHFARAKKEGKHFYIGCGFHRPHAAYISTEDAWSRYSGANISAAAHRTMHPSVPSVAMIVNFGIGLENGSHYPWDPRSMPVPVEVQLAVRRHYYSAITWMDSLVGEVLASLDEHGFTNNTVVIFHADHGYFMGESGEWEKKMLFENTARVPLLIHDPAHPTQMRTTELAELVDVCKYY